MSNNFRPSLTVLQSLNTPTPDPVLDVIAQNPAADGFDVVWSEPSLNGTTLDHYELQVREVPGGNFVDYDIAIPPGQTNLTLTGLLPETEYEVRVKAVAVEGSGAYGNRDDIETTPDIPLFNADFAYFSVANITSVYLVSIDNGNQITQNGAVVANLNAGDTQIIPAGQFDEFIGTGAFHAMGLISNDWFTLNPNYTVGKKFAYGPIRNNPQTVSVYAFQDSNITITVGGVVQATGFVPANSGQNFTYSIVNQNVIIESDGLVMVSQTSNGAVDQTALLPASTELLGFPSNSARVYPTEDMTFWGAYRANGDPRGGGGHEDTTQEGSIAGTGSQYSGDAVLVQANKPITAASFADSDGGKAAPFLPSTLARTRFGVPFVVERVTFAGTQPFTITTSNGNTYNSAGSNAVQYLRILDAADRAAGTLYTSSAPVGAWSEPDLNDQDEFVLFGF